MKDLIWMVVLFLLGAALIITIFANNKVLASEVVEGRVVGNVIIFSGNGKAQFKTKNKVLTCRYYQGKCYEIISTQACGKRLRGDIFYTVPEYIKTFGCVDHFQVLALHMVLETNKHPRMIMEYK